MTEWFSSPQQRWTFFSPLQVFLSFPGKGHFADSHVIISVAVVEAAEKEKKDEFFSASYTSIHPQNLIEVKS